MKLRNVFIFAIICIMVFSITEYSWWPSIFNPVNYPYSTMTEGTIARNTLVITSLALLMGFFVSILVTIALNDVFLGIEEHKIYERATKEAELRKIIREEIEKVVSRVN